MTLPEMLSEAEKICFDDAWSLNSVSSLLKSENSICAVLTDDNGLVGYAVGAISADEAELYRIAVMPECRRNGVGQRLMSDFIGKCRGRATKLFLEVRSHNSVAVALYTKNGFEKIAIRRNYYGDDDAVIFSLDL